MDAQNGIIEHRLAPRASVVLTGAAGIEVSCRSGCVWLTQYGDDRDIVLEPGRAFVLSLPTAVVMSSSKGASVGLRRLASAAAGGPGWSWLRRLAGWFDPRRGSAVARQLHGRLAMLDAAALPAPLSSIVAGSQPPQEPACSARSSSSGSSSPAAIPTWR